MRNDNFNLDALVIRIRNTTSRKLKEELLRNAFSTQEIPYVEAWIKRLEEEERIAPVTLYHRRKAPDGKIFKAFEVPTLEKKGWLDSPDKFKKGIISKIRNLIKRIIKSLWTFWLRHWPILLPIIVAFFGILVKLFIYLDSKATTKAQQEKNETKNKIDIIHTTPK